MSTYLRRCAGPGASVLVQAALSDGTGEGLRAIVEAHEVGDPSYAADYFDVDVSESDLTDAVTEVLVLTRQSLDRRFPGTEVLSVWRAGEVGEVVSVTTREGGVPQFGEAHAFTITKADVLADVALIGRGTFEEGELLVRGSGLRRTALPMSWRPLSGSNFVAEYDCVIITEKAGRRRRYEVYTYGVAFANYDRLDEAKAGVEALYGPLPWRRISMPLQEAVHYYFGPTTEFTDPLTIYVVDSLPRLGSRHAATLPWVGRDWPLRIAEVSGAGFTSTRVLLAYLDVRDGDFEEKMPVGALTWDPTRRTAELVFVQPAWRGHGVARMLWEAANRIDGPLAPGTRRSPAGDAFQRAVSGQDTPAAQHALDAGEAEALGNRLLSRLYGLTDDDIIRQVGAKTAFHRSDQKRVVTLKRGSALLTYIPELEGGLLQAVLAETYEGGTEMGFLTWERNQPVVNHVEVHEPYRRSGLATAMWEFASELEPDLRHSHLLLPEGRAWLESLGHRHAATFPEYNRLLPGGFQFSLRDSRLDADTRVIDATAVSEQRPLSLGGVGSLTVVVGSDGQATITDAYVEPGYRQQGVASGLLRGVREYLAPIEVLHSTTLTSGGEAWSRSVGVKTAFRQNLDWKVIDARPDYQSVEAVYLGIRFVLQGSDTTYVDSNWGKQKRNGWRLEILEPGDRVNLGIPHHHKFDDDTIDWRDREVKSTFDTLAEGRTYVEDWLIGKGIVDQMVQRDFFEPGAKRYHLTLARHVPAILSQGLHPRSQVGTGSSVFDDLTKATLILWDLKNEDWATHQGEPLALLELDVGGMRRSTVTSLSSEERVNEVIPPQRIKVVIQAIPWYLTESRFGGWGMSEAEILALLKGDPAAARKAWSGSPEELDALLAVGAKTAGSLPLEWDHRGKVLYHGTSPYVADLIRERGFVIPTAPTGRGADYGYAVYFTPFKDWALDYSRGGLIKATLKPHAHILDLAYAEAEGLTDKHYDAQPRDFWPAFAREHGWHGVTTNGEVVAIYDTSVLDILPPSDDDLVEAGDWL